MFYMKNPNFDGRSGEVEETGGGPVTSHVVFVGHSAEIRGGWTQAPVLADRNTGIYPSLSSLLCSPRKMWGKEAGT